VRLIPQSTHENKYPQVCFYFIFLLFCYYYYFLIFFFFLIFNTLNLSKGAIDHSVAFPSKMLSFVNAMSTFLPPHFKLLIFVINLIKKIKSLKKYEGVANGRIATVTTSMGKSIN
jgi:hypothetical protein